MVAVVSTRGRVGRGKRKSPTAVAQMVLAWVSAANFCPARLHAHGACAAEHSSICIMVVLSCPAQASSEKQMQNQYYRCKSFRTRRAEWKIFTLVGTHTKSTLHLEYLDVLYPGNW